MSRIRSCRWCLYDIRLDAGGWRIDCGGEFDDDPDPYECEGLFGEHEPMREDYE